MTVQWDTVFYPLAEVHALDIVIDEVLVRVKAAVADRQPVSILLGTDDPLYSGSC